MYRSTIAVIAVVISLAISGLLAADNDPFQGGTDHGVSSPLRIAKVRSVANLASINRPAEERIREELDKKTTLDCSDTPLNAVIDYFQTKHGIPIVLDQEALKAAGIDSTATLVTKSLKDISLGSALNLLLRDFNLTFLIKDEVLVITSKERAESTLTTRMYDVRDLAAHDNNVPDPKLLNQLIEVIAHTIEPETWKTDKNPASGDIRSFNSNDICVLVVFQTYDVHEKISALLDELRTHKSPKAAKE